MTSKHMVASRGLLVTLVLLAALPLLSLNMFLPSLGVMASEFVVGYNAMALTISTYLLFTAFIQLIAGPAADRYGRRPIVLIGLLIFGFSSLGCVYAQSYEVFFLWRALQAAVATAGVLSRAIVGDIFPPQRSASVLGYIAMGMSVAPILGPMIGGVMGETLGWRANFYIYAVCALGLILQVFFLLPETASERKKPMKAFMRSYFALCRSALFWAYSMVMACGIGGFFVFVTGIPLVATAEFGANEATTGILIGSITCGFLFGSFLSGRMSLSHSLDRMILYGRGFGTFGLAISFMLLLFGYKDMSVVLLGALSVGVGNGLATPSASTAVMNVRRELSGSASGLSGCLIVVIGALVTSLTGIFMQIHATSLMLIALMLSITATGLGFAIWAAVQIKPYKTIEASSGY